MQIYQDVSNTTEAQVDQFFLFNQFYAGLLDYSILLKAKHVELSHESITLHNHEQEYIQYPVDYTCNTCHTNTWTIINT